MEEDLSLHTLNMVYTLSAVGPKVLKSTAPMIALDPKHSNATLR